MHSPRSLVLPLCHSVFYDEGSLARVVGNIGIALFTAVCQYLATRVAIRRCYAVSPCPRESDVGAMLRFPAVSIRLVEVLLPGTTLAALLCFWVVARGAIASGVFGIVAVTMELIGLEYYYTRRYALPHCLYSLYDDTTSDLLSAAPGKCGC